MLFDLIGDQSRISIYAPREGSDRKHAQNDRIDFGQIYNFEKIYLQNQSKK